MTMKLVSQNLIRANSHLKKGELLEAETLYSEVLMSFPKNVKAQQGLAKLRKGAAKSLKAELPQRLLNNLIGLINEGKLELAVAQATNISAYYLQAITLWNILGIAFAQLSKFDQAIEAFDRIITLEPRQASAYYNLGNVYKDTGRIQDAIAAYTEALELKPNYVDAYNNLTIVLAGQDQVIEERQLDVIKRYKSLQMINAEKADEHFKSGVLLLAEDKLDEAIEEFKKAIEAWPKYSKAYFNIGNALRLQGKLAEAVDAYSKALSIKPDNAKAHNNLGNALLDQGKTNAAIASYKKALSINPEFAVAYRNLSALTKFRPNDPQINKIEALLHHPNLSKDDRCHLYYANAKIQEDLGNFGDAFDCYSAGGKLRQSLLSYEFKQDENLFHEIKSVAPQFLEIADKLSFQKASLAPIFILGMPRSGTTLVEQIVSAHGNVSGAGELEFVAKFGGNLAVGRENINTHNINEFRRQYLLQLTKRAEGKSYVTDKMPHNFRFIGLICASFPEAKIIHVQRNAAATCWSNFTHYFASNSLGYSYDLSDTVKYYRLYSDLMNHWQALYGNRIYTLDYEKLTESQEPEIRKLIEFLGLSWDDACLAPEKNQRSISTASQQQVRKKIYKNSSQAWQKYHAYIANAFDGLN